MSDIKQYIDYKKIFKNQELRVKLVGFLRFIPNKPYLNFVFFINNGRRIRFKDPMGFSDKLQYLKIHDKHNEYTDYVDKIKVREIVKDKIGDGYLFEQYGNWESFDQIDFGSLPEVFVLKCNHDSGSTRVIKKSELDDKKLSELRKFYKRRLNLNPYWLGREYPYKNVRSRILAEAYMVDTTTDELRDYKFFCFNGKPVIMFVATGRGRGDTCFDFFDMEYNHLNIIHMHTNAKTTPKKPQSFEQMKELAAILSEGMKFVRIDFYEIDGQPYFGEYTFFHGGGFTLFDDYYEKVLGEKINVK